MSNTSASNKAVHYRDRHRSLKRLPPSSTKHGFRSRMKKTSKDALESQSAKPALCTVMSFSDTEPSVEYHLTTSNYRTHASSSSKFERRTKSVSGPGYSRGDKKSKLTPEIITAMPRLGGSHSPQDSDNTPSSATCSQQADYLSYNTFEQLQLVDSVGYGPIDAPLSIHQPELYLQSSGQQNAQMTITQFPEIISPTLDENNHFYSQHDYQQFASADPRFAAIAGPSSIVVDPVASFSPISTADYNDPAYYSQHFPAPQGPLYYVPNQSQY